MIVVDYIPSFLLFILFCLSHSLFASVKIKARIFDRFPSFKPFYRLIYNISSLILLALFAYTLPPDNVLYSASGLLFVLLITIQVISALSALFTLRGHGSEFLGLRQIKEFLRSGRMPGYLDEPEKGELIRKGFYRYIRHPLYTFSMILLLAMPVMTLNLVFIITLTGIYFYTGTFFEERKLIKRFGNSYRQYREEVPRFLPRVSAIINI